jgi:hypothetical protein
VSAGGLAVQLVNILFRVCLPPSRLHAPVSRSIPTVSLRTLLNIAGYREGKLELTKRPRPPDRGCGNSRRFPPGDARADRSGRSGSEEQKRNGKCVMMNGEIEESCGRSILSLSSIWSVLLARSVNHSEEPKKPDRPDDQERQQEDSRRLFRADEPPAQRPDGCADGIGQPILPA